ncbi:hypothetical protein HWV62_30109 [Athelia sp. TMB]|nr:hypothetical protein HWV62_30109 [Athelia sp. TMB]
MPSSTILTDPTSQAYKKALRQHLKSTSNRDKDVELSWTNFRVQEKAFKARFPPPDLSRVLDLTAPDTFESEAVPGGWHGKPDAVETREIALKGMSDQKAYIVPRIPGLVLLPSFVSPVDQKSLVRWALRDHAKSPNETNLDAHYVVPDDGLWNTYVGSEGAEEVIIQPRALVSPERVIAEPTGPRKLISNTAASLETFEALSLAPKPPPPASATVQPASCSSLIKKLRWANIGWNYHWGTKHYDFSKGPGAIDPLIRDMCKRAVETVDWNQVFGVNDDTNKHSDWGPEGPDWHTWTDTYGMHH